MTHVQTYEVEMCFCGNPNAIHLRNDLCPPTKNPIRAESAFAQYQRKASETAIYPSEKALEYLALGLVSEAGEVAGKVKKLIRDGAEGRYGAIPETFRADLKKELGDVLWYLAELCTENHLDLHEVAEANLVKLADRASRGAIKGSGDER